MCPVTRNSESAEKGFIPPVRDWLRAIWVENEDAIQDPELLLASGLLDPSALRKELASPLARSGRVNQMALRLATLELWLRGSQIWMQNGSDGLQFR